MRTNTQTVIRGADDRESPFAGRLLPGERILWQGRAAQGLILTAQDAYVIPFSLLWGGFSFFWESAVLSTAAPLEMKLWGVPFVLIGLFLIFGRFLVDAWLRRHVRYMLTDRRALILRQRPWTVLRAVDLESRPEIELAERADGSGTIGFGPAASVWGRQGFGNVLPSLAEQPRFLRVPDAARVFTQAQTAMRRGR